MVDSRGYSIDFAGHLRDPKAVNHVGGGRGDERGAADRKMEFIGADRVDAVVGIAELPPPLVTDHIHADLICAGADRRRVFREDGLDGRNRDDQQNDGRNDRPGDFEPRIAMRLGGQSAPWSPKPDQDIEQGPFHTHEDDQRHPKDELVQILDMPACGRQREHGSLGSIRRVSSKLDDSADFTCAACQHENDE